MSHLSKVYPGECFKHNGKIFIRSNYNLREQTATNLSTGDVTIFAKDEIVEIVKAKIVVSE